MTAIPGQRGIDFTPRDPSVTPVEAKRLSAQCQAILDRLRQGPASNRELAVLSLKYTSRLSDLRAAGYSVICYDRDTATGLTWYRLGLTLAPK